MLACTEPLRGAVGKLMIKSLYKPISIEPITDVPPCVVSLIRSMWEKDRNQRPQTPRDLQNAIVGCLEEIDAHSTQDLQTAAEAPCQSFSPGALVGQKYRLIEELSDSPEGRHFLAEDLLGKRQVSLLILNQALVSDPHWFTPLQTAIERVRIAPHPLLRAIYSLERAGGHAVLVEEHVVGPSLLELLRSRSVLSAPEVVRLLSVLAPLADHASANQLEHIDFTLLGIRFLNRDSTAREIPDLLRCPITDWAQVEPKVNAIDFSFTPSQAGTMAGLETRTQSAAGTGPRGSCVRALSLLAYELLGGPRARVEATGRYNPIAALTQQGNAVLRRGLIDECRSASELAAQLRAAVGIKDSAVRVLERRESVTPEPLPRLRAEVGIKDSPAPVLERSEPVTPEPPPSTLPPKPPPSGPAKHISITRARLLFLAIAFIFFVGISGYLFLRLSEPQEIAALSVQTDPPGASLLLDGKPPQSPNTFTHVPFGKHQLSATLKDYEPIKKDIEVSRGMVPEIRLTLGQVQEIAALSVQTHTPGASLLLDGKPPQSPNTFTHVPFGKHQLSATLKDYEPIKKDIEVSRGMIPEIRLTLGQIQEIAALSVQTDPPGASLLLDGKPPQSPNTFTHVPFGTHQLTATLDKYEASNQEIQVAKGMPSEIHVTLIPKSSPCDALVAEVKKYGEGTPEQVTALVRLVQCCTSSKTPDAEEHTKELAEAIEQLRTKTPPITKDEFSAAYKTSIKDAADLNILPAILSLAENEKGRESFDLFLRAATLGDSYAMMNIGKLYLYKRTAADDVQAFSWLKRAYESAKPNLEAGAYLGFCYLHGRGTKKDENEGKKITLSLANQNVVFAMTEAGVLLAVEAQQKREKAAADALLVQARQWWERAAEKNDWNASARLGPFSQEGLGGLTKSDEH